MRFPLQGVVQLETITFLTATALQRKLSLADFSALAPARRVRAGSCDRFAARPSASANLTTSSQAHLPMGRAHPQGAVTRLCVPPHPAFQCSDAPCTFLRAFPAMPLWRVVVINSNLSNPICKVAKNKNAIVQRLLDVLHKPFQAAVNRSTIWLAKCDNDNPCVDRVQ